MVEPIRIPPKEVRDKVIDGKALLVCAYDNEGRFNANHLEGALSLNDFKAELSSLPKDKEIIFYCA